ncbi:MlaD family protein [Brucella intermedia]|uniref:MlaD family protein n=1 Tax=Brucella intermedia TaxID=94625 RepID=UPI0023618B8B|nr:MlaD family protein [Brucella intermedia]
MTQSDLSANEGQLSTPRITTRRNRLSAIWIVPFIAASIALYLAWISISERGPQITLTLPTAEGIEAGKTQIRYKAINFGTVTNVVLSPDGHHVMVTAAMTKQAAVLLHKRSLFWVVRPRISASTGISGLSTIVSGVYIEFDPGEGDDFSDTFVALDTPPVIATDAAGSEFTLETPKIG